MKTVVVYYSMGGNTALAAEQIAGLLGADLLRIEPKQAYPDSGFRKFFWGGKSAVMAEAPELAPYVFDSNAYDRVIFGFPVWAGNITPPIRTFIRDNDLRGKQFAAFACQSGAGAEKAFGKLKACLETQTLSAELILIDPKDKPAKENEQKIAEFCSKLQ
ncbi:MAG: flavodoxin [Clostridia bacterium]|nr:flavodoxin [Clostridia bacterium]